MTYLMLVVFGVLGCFIGWGIRDHQADVEETRRWDKGCRCDYREGGQ